MNKKKERSENTNKPFYSQSRKKDRKRNTKTE